MRARKQKQKGDREKERKRERKPKREDRKEGREKLSMAKEKLKRILSAPRKYSLTDEMTDCCGILCDQNNQRWKKR